MARISLHIEADSLTDLADTLAGLRYPTAYTSDVPEPPNEEEPKASFTQDAEPGEQTRRTRRTKAQIAADEAAQRNVSGRTGADASVNSAGPDESTARTDSDPFSEQPEKKSPATSSASSASLTHEDVRRAMSDFLGRDGNDAMKMKKIFTEFKNTDGEAVVRVSDLQLVDCAAAIEALRA